MGLSIESLLRLANATPAVGRIVFGLASWLVIVAVLAYHGDVLATSEALLASLRAPGRPVIEDVRHWLHAAPAAEVAAVCLPWLVAALVVLGGFDGRPLGRGVGSRFAWCVMVPVLAVRDGELRLTVLAMVAGAAILSAAVVVWWFVDSRFGEPKRVVPNPNELIESVLMASFYFVVVPFELGLAAAAAASDSIAPPLGPESTSELDSDDSTLQQAHRGGSTTDGGPNLRPGQVRMKRTDDGARMAAPNNRGQSSLSHRGHYPLK